MIDPAIRDYLTYNAETGAFRWIKHAGQRALVGQDAGTFNHGYRRIKFRGRVYEAHRLAWWFVHGTMPRAPQEIDHRNLNRADNRIENLRLATRSQNKANARANRTSTSGIKGVYRNKTFDRWVAQIGVAGRRLWLGTFDSKVAAARAYASASRQHFGEFANTGGGHL